jgi:CarD family transcriptional regulator
MFKEKEKVVYPGHGVAIIDRLLERKIGGKVTKFFELKFINKDMTILVPVDNIESIGIRKLSTEKDIGKLFQLFSEPVELHHNEVALNWNKRNKVYQGKIRSGNIKEIGQIYRDLRYIERQKELSFGEKNLLQQTEALLAEEIAFACDIGSEAAADQLRVLAQKEWQ